MCIAPVDLSVLAVGANESLCELLADDKKCIGLLLELALDLLENIVLELD